MFHKYAPLVTLFLFATAWSQSSPPPSVEPSKDASIPPTGQLEDSKNLIIVKAKKPVYPIVAEDKQTQAVYWCIFLLMNPEMLKKLR